MSTNNQYKNRGRASSSANMWGGKTPNPLLKDTIEGYPIVLSHQKRTANAGKNTMIQQGLQRDKDGLYPDPGGAGYQEAIARINPRLAPGGSQMNRPTSSAAFQPTASPEPWRPTREIVKMPIKPADRLTGIAEELVGGEGQVYFTRHSGNLVPFNDALAMLAEEMYPTKFYKETMRDLHFITEESLDEFLEQYGRVTRFNERLLNRLDELGEDIDDIVEDEYPSARARKGR